jgi:hypothetical protein
MSQNMTKALPGLGVAPGLPLPRWRWPRAAGPPSPASCRWPRAAGPVPLVAGRPRSDAGRRGGRPTAGPNAAGLPLVRMRPAYHWSECGRPTTGPEAAGAERGGLLGRGVAPQVRPVLIR